jgi:hypothetical protein
MALTEYNLLAFGMLWIYKPFFGALVGDPETNNVPPESKAATFHKNQIGRSATDAPRFDQHRSISR